MVIQVTARQNIQISDIILLKYIQIICFYQQK